MAAARLDPARDAGRAKAGGQTGIGGELAHVLRRAHPARAEEGALGRAHSRPSVSGRPNIRLRFWIACEEVPFQRLSIAESTTIFPVC